MPSESDLAGLRLKHLRKKTNGWIYQIEVIENYLSSPMCPIFLKKEHKEALLSRVRQLSGYIHNHDQLCVWDLHRLILPKYGEVDRTMQEFFPGYGTAQMLFRIRHSVNDSTKDMSKQRRKEFIRWLERFIRECS